MKKIVAIKVERVPDPTAGSDYLGRYLDRPPPDRFYVVRESGQLKQPDGTTVANAAGVPVGRNECRYFIPANHVPHDAGNWSHVSAADMAEVTKRYGGPEQADYHYALEDWKRAEALEQGEWSYVGVKALAQVATSTDDRSWLTQRLASGGLWGIESDSDEDYFEEVGREELATVSTVLRELGFATAEIDSALSTVQQQETQ